MRVTALLSPIAFTALATALVVIGAIPWTDAAWASGAVALAFVPSGWWSFSLNRRRAAEAMLIPAAFAITMIAGAAMRRMLLPPLLILAAWAVFAAARGSAPPRRWPFLAASFGLSVRAATGLGLTGFGFSNIVVAVFIAAVVPWATARRWGPRSAELAVLATAILPWQRWPLLAAVVLVLALGWGATGSGTRFERACPGWLPGVGAVGLLVSSTAAWPGLSASLVLPVHEWWVWVLLVIALALTTRLRPGMAGALWFVAALLLGPALAPTPEHRAFVLSPELGRWTAPSGSGDPYIVDLEVRESGGLAAGTPVALVSIAGEEHALSAGDESAERIWRPSGPVGSRAGWRWSARHHLVVPAGVRPVMSRHPELQDEIIVRVASVGPARQNPPRSWALPAWLLAAAVAVVLLQVMSGSWRGTAATVPWLVLVTGALVARSPVEPLHLLGERLAPDMALAALMAAWVPAVRLWFARGRVAVAVSALLVPLALATPQLTPSMYGDEPFHLLLMESMTEDHDLDVSNNLDLEHRPQNRLYAPGWPLFHSPGLGFLLWPGYLVAGRSGALVALALMGAALAALLAKRARMIGVGESRVRLLVMAAAVTYPLATFSTQIWPELPGAFAVAVLLILTARPRGGGLTAVAVAVAAAIVKTRLALLVFPMAAAAWWRRNRAVGSAVLIGAAVAVMGIGWLAMGHPFGPYRRLHHLLPSDPALAVRVAMGLVFDAAGGLAFSAPLMLVAVAGAAALWRRGGLGERALLSGCLLTLAALLHSTEWYGGGAPPARYLVAMLPAFFLAGGMVLQQPRRWRRLTVVLLPPSMVAWWVLITRPHFSVNPGDGGYWFADALARRFAADARDFFPSFLVPNTATVAVPITLVVMVLLTGWASTRSPVVGSVLRHSWIAVWMVAGAGLVWALGTVPDHVVEAEAPQVRRAGGGPEPGEGAVARYSHRRGWRLGDGDRVVVPLRLGGDSKIVLEGWLLGTARRQSDFMVRWNDGPVTVLSWRGGSEPPGQVELPPAPGAGSHRLSISFACPPEGAVVLDRLTVEPQGGGPGAGGSS